MYIDNLIDSKNALELFYMLKKAINSFKPGSFLEVNNVKNTINFGTLI